MDPVLTKPGENLKLRIEIWVSISEPHHIGARHPIVTLILELDPIDYKSNEEAKSPVRLWSMDEPLGVEPH